MINGPFSMRGIVLLVPRFGGCWGSLDIMKSCLQSSLLRSQFLRLAHTEAILEEDPDFVDRDPLCDNQLAFGEVESDGENSLVSG